MIGHEVEVSFAAPEDAPAMEDMDSRMVAPSFIQWRSYWRADVNGGPFRYASLVVFDVDVMASASFDADVAPAWIPRPPAGWDDAVEASWQAFMAERATS
jgi:hypothetical protein